MSGSLHSQTDVAQNRIQAEAHPCPPGALPLIVKVPFLLNNLFFSSHFS